MSNNKIIQLKKMYSRSKKSIVVGRRESNLAQLQTLLSELGFTNQKSKAA
jgi:hypothetical protein